MLRDRAKQKAKSKVKSKAKNKVRGEIREEVGGPVRSPGGPKVLKAAAVGGTAYYAGKKISEKRHEDDVKPDTSIPAATPGLDPVAQLQQLAQLHESGALTDEEFAAAKQKLLANG